MTLAGTRPPTVDEWDKYELHHRARLATKPGLTGMWQVSGRSNITDLQNPEVKAEYDALQPEYDIIQAMIDARVQQNMTQKDLSAKTGITQADISRIENGTRNPSLSMVKKLAQGLGMQLKLEFVPMPTKNKM